MRPRRDCISTAYHEAGHAVVARHLGRGVTLVSMRGGMSDAGHCAYTPRRVPFDDLPPARQRRVGEVEILILYAGQLASAKPIGLPLPMRPMKKYGGQWDNLAALDYAWKMAAGLVESKAIAVGIFMKCRALIESEPIWKGIERVAQQLYKRGELNRRELDELLAD